MSSTQVGLENLLDDDDPPRPWQEEFFRRALKYGPRVTEDNKEAILACSADLVEAGHTSYVGGQIGSGAFAKALVLSRAFQLSGTIEACTAGDIHHMVGHLLEGSMTEKQEQEWRTLAAARSDGAPAYTRPGFTGVVSLVIGDLFRWKKVLVIKELFEFAYFGYTSFHERLIEESWSEIQWRQNLIEIVPYLITRHHFPLQIDGQAPWMLEAAELSRYADEEKKVGEIFANVFTALATVYSGHLKDDLQHFREDFEQIRKEKGRLEARKHLIFLHRNRLWIPTYFFKELSAAS